MYSVILPHLSSICFTSTDSVILSYSLLYLNYLKGRAIEMPSLEKIFQSFLSHGTNLLPKANDGRK